MTIIPTQIDFADLPNDLPIAIVTGGASGIGLAIVDDLARDHLVIALGRNIAKLQTLEGRKNVLPVQVDLTDPEAITAFAENWPKLDVLVNCAAVSEWKTLEESRQGDWTSTFQTNVFAPAELTRLLLPALRVAQGQVVFISSGAGTRPVVGHIVYTASKHALKGLTDTLRLEEVKNGIRVATVAPGPTDTPLNRASTEGNGLDTPANGERSDAASVARAVRLVVDTPRDSQVTDITIRPRLL